MSRIMNLTTRTRSAGRSVLLGPAFLLLALLAPVHALGQTTERSAEQVAQGRELYQQFCLVCHGAKGQGTTLGPTITSVSVTASPDADLARVISQGRAANGMPMFGRSLEREEIDSLVGYLRTLQNASAEGRVEMSAEPSPIDVSTGDVRKGQELFRGKANCVQCHTTFFVGGSVGPDLSEIARSRSQADIHKAVTEPSDKVLREFRAKKLVTSDGRTVIGRFRNETPESVQLLSEDGTLWTTYMKSGLTSDETLRDRSIMPDNVLAPLSEDETRDLFAYLYSLK